MGLRRVPMKIIRQKSVGDVRDFDSRRMKLYLYTHKYGVRKYTFLGRNDKHVELDLYTYLSYFGPLLDSS
jgi:hypothetical protein